MYVIDFKKRKLSICGTLYRKDISREVGEIQIKSGA